MSAVQQHFWDVFYAWSLGLGFVVLIVLVGMFWNLAWDRRIPNPFKPFVRAMERRQQHRQRMQEMKMRVQLIKAGMDPDYVKFLEGKETA